MKLFAKLFAAKKDTPEKKYGGFSDFFIRASKEEKMKVFREAAQGANEEQRRTANAGRRPMEVVN